MKRVLAVLFLCLSTQAFAMKVADVKVEDKVRVNSAQLILNGAGVRSKMMFEVYVAALYLGEKKTSAAAVMSDTGTKRVALHMMRHVDAGDFMDAFIKAVKANHNPEEFVSLAGRFLKFTRVFTNVGVVDKGDVITLDYLPATESSKAITVVGVNGKERERMEGDDFYRALLRIWLGERPVQDDLKKEMLGAAP
jgi:hypothetical protein